MYLISIPDHELQLESPTCVNARGIPPALHIRPGPVQ